MNICTGWSPPCTGSRETIIAHASVKVKDVASAASDGAHFSCRKGQIYQCKLDKFLKYHTELMQNNICNKYIQVGKVSCL